MPGKRGFVSFAGVFACCWLNGVAEAAPSEATSAPLDPEDWAQTDRARELFRLGFNAFQAGRLEEARQLFTEAWELRRTYDVAASLAQVEHDLGHYARSARLLEFCLNNFAPIESDTNLRQLRSAFDDVRKRVGRIELDTVTPGAQVWVDNERVGTAPLGIPMYLEPGAHDVEVRMGDVSVHHALRVKAGGVHRIDADTRVNRRNGRLPSEGPRTDTASLDSTTPVEPAVGERPRFPYFLGGVLFVTGATVGIASHVAAHAADRRAESARQSDTPCSATTVESRAACEREFGARTDERFHRNLAVLGYGIAATALVATAVYWLWPSAIAASKPERQLGMSWSLGCEPTGAWVSAFGHFP